MSPNFTCGSLSTAVTAATAHYETAVLIFHWLHVWCQDRQNAQIAAPKSKDDKSQCITSEQNQTAVLWFTETKLQTRKPFSVHKQ